MSILIAYDGSPDARQPSKRPHACSPAPPPSCSTPGSRWKTSPPTWKGTLLWKICATSTPGPWTPPSDWPPKAPNTPGLSG